MERPRVPNLGARLASAGPSSRPSDAQCVALRRRVDLGSRLARSIAVQWKLCANIAHLLIPTMCCRGRSREMLCWLVSPTRWHWQGFALLRPSMSDWTSCRSWNRPISGHSGLEFHTRTTPTRSNQNTQLEGGHRDVAIEFVSHSAKLVPALVACADLQNETLEPSWARGPLGLPPLR
jgi:hypothetical protein